MQNSNRKATTKQKQNEKQKKKYKLDCQTFQSKRAVENLWYQVYWIHIVNKEVCDEKQTNLEHV